MAAKWFIPVLCSSAHAHPPSDGQQKRGALLDRRGVNIFHGWQQWIAKDASRSPDRRHHNGLCVSSTRNGDNYTGILECAALVLALSTLHDLLKSAAVTAHIENQGVLGAVDAGGSKCSE